MQPDNSTDRNDRRSTTRTKWVAGACMAALASGAVAATHAPAGGKSSDTPRPGAYGRIAVRGAPPPLIYPEPVLVRPSEGPANQPVYLYVPPGQVRHWAQHCAKWDACERPVYFVRVDDSPSRLGSWKKTQRSQPDESTVLQVLYRLTP